MRKTLKNLLIFLCLTQVGWSNETHLTNALNRIRHLECQNAKQQEIILKQFEENKKLIRYVGALLCMSSIKGKQDGAAPVGFSEVIFERTVPDSSGGITRKKGEPHKVGASIGQTYSGDGGLEKKHYEINNVIYQQQNRIKELEAMVYQLLKPQYGNLHFTLNTHHFLPSYEVASHPTHAVTRADNFEYPSQRLSSTAEIASLKKHLQEHQNSLRNQQVVIDGLLINNEKLHQNSNQLNAVLKESNKSLIPYVYPSSYTEDNNGYLLIDILSETESLDLDDYILNSKSKIERYRETINLTKKQLTQQNRKDFNKLAQTPLAKEEKGLKNIEYSHNSPSSFNNNNEIPLSFCASTKELKSSFSNGDEKNLADNLRREKYQRNKKKFFGSPKKISNNDYRSVNYKLKKEIEKNKILNETLCDLYGKNYSYEEKIENLNRISYSKSQQIIGLSCELANKDNHIFDLEGKKNEKLLANKDKYRDEIEQLSLLLDDLNNEIKYYDLEWSIQRDRIKELQGELMQIEAESAAKIQDIINKTDETICTKDSELHQMALCLLKEKQKEIDEQKCKFGMMLISNIFIKKDKEKIKKAFKNYVMYRAKEQESLLLNEFYGCLNNEAVEKEIEKQMADFQIALICKRAILRNKMEEKARVFHPLVQKNHGDIDDNIFRDIRIAQTMAPPSLTKENHNIKSIILTKKTFENEDPHIPRSAPTQKNKIITCLEDTECTDHTGFKSDIKKGKNNISDPEREKEKSNITQFNGITRQKIEGDQNIFENKYQKNMFITPSKLFDSDKDWPTITMEVPSKKNVISRKKAGYSNFDIDDNL